MKQLSNLFKSITALIYVMPGIFFFAGFGYPENISKVALLAICEICAAIVILLVLINKKKLFAKLKDKLVKFIAICSALLLILVISFTFFSGKYISNTVNGQKVLLPLNCKEPLCMLMKIAKENREEIGIRLGKDRLIDIINTSNKTELVQSELLYDTFLVCLFTLLVLLFIILGIFYEKENQPVSFSELAAQNLKSNFKIYTSTYLQKQNAGNYAQVKFHIFLSYSAKQRSDAENIYHALLNNQHMVFFDRDSLPKGMEYNMAIHSAINCSDIMIFLISPDAVKAGHYTLSELKFARDRWPDANKGLMPVMADKTPYDTIPAYARSINIFEAEGNLAAELTVEIEKRYKDLKKLEE